MPPKYSDPVSLAVHSYLRTGVLPPTDIQVPIPGPDQGPGRGMTGCITSSDIKAFAAGWYIGNDGELYRRGEGPGEVRFDKEAEKVLSEREKKGAFFDWNE